MKPKDLLHAMNELDPKLLEQSIRIDGAAETPDMTAEYEQPSEREQPVMRFFRILIGAAVFAACAAIVTGGVLWMRYARSQRPQIADPPAVQTERASQTAETGTDAVTAVQSSAQQGDLTEAVSETGSPVQNTDTMLVSSDASAPASSGNPSDTVMMTTRTTGEASETRMTEPTSHPVSLWSSAKTETSLTEPTKTTQPENRFPCTVTAKVWHSPWYSGGRPGNEQNVALVIHSRKQMAERNAVDGIDYVFNQCDWATDAFFAENDLVVCALTYGSGSIDAGVQKLELIRPWYSDPADGKESRLTLRLADFEPSCRTCDMCTVCAAVTVPKGLLPENLVRVYTVFEHFTEYQIGADGNEIYDPSQHEKFLASVSENPVLDYMIEE